VLKGKLQLTKPAEPRGRRLPVDILFRSLAEDLAERAVAVVLSGMGQDGTLGVAAIKAAGGLTAAQQPDDAQFNSMPAAAIASGQIDLIASAAALPEQILMQLQHSVVTIPPHPALEQPAVTASPLQQIISRLQQQTRHDFSSYKLSTLQRRIERRMAIHSCASLKDYAALVYGLPQEVELLFKELLIGVTQFFRDESVWQYLSTDILPLLLQQASEQPLRAWCLGCSTGEEAYSLAIAFCQLQAAQPQYLPVRLQIFASDISPDAIAFARRGQYPLSLIAALSEAQQRFFVRHDSYYQIRQSIRDMVLFAEHNAILDPPFTRQDLIICRNVLIYFDAALQRKLLPLLHYSLKSQGVLLLGSSETIGPYQDLFQPLQAKLRFYQRREPNLSHRCKLPLHAFPPLSTLAKEYPVTPSNAPSPQPDNLQHAADQVLLQVYAPAAVLLNSDADIV
jgi:two-component system CheB/CheR fusion protein